MRINQRQFVRYAVTGVVVAAAISSLMIYLNPRQNFAGKPEFITLAHAQFESTTLVWVAEEQHFFNRNGLTIASRKYDSGVGALDGMLHGEADIAVGVT